MSKHSSYLLYVCVILLGAVLLRLWNIDHLPMWTDEGWTIWLIEDGSLASTFDKLNGDRHPPLYFALMTVWQNLAGTSHLALRFPSFLFGIVSIALTLNLAKRVFDIRVALIAGIFLSILDISIHYSQEVRHYGMLTMMALIVMLLCVALITKQSRLRWIFYILSVCGLMLTHYFGVFVMVMQAIYILFVWQGAFKDKRQFVLAWLMSAVLYLVWLPTILVTFSAISQGVGNFPNSYESNLTDFIKILDVLTSGQALLLGGLYVIALLRIKWNSTQTYLVMAGIGTFILMFLFNFSAGVLSNRMLAYLVPPLCIMVAYGFLQFTPLIRYAFVPLIILVLIATPITIQPRIPADESAMYLSNQYSVNDYIVLETGWEDNNMAYEISQEIPQAERVRTIWLWNPETIQNTVMADIADYDRVWVAHWLHAAVILPQLLEDDTWQLAMTHQVLVTDDIQPATDPEIDLYLFERVNLENNIVEFDNGLTLQDALFSPTVNDETLHVDLWWQTTMLLNLDYSINLRLVDDNGQVISNLDVPISADGTSSWGVNNLNFSRYSIPIPTFIRDTNLTIQATVYYYQDPQNPLEANNDSVITLGTVRLQQ